MAGGQMYLSAKAKRGTGYGGRRKTKKKKIAEEVRKAVVRGVTSYSSLRSRSLIAKKSVITLPYSAVFEMKTQSAELNDTFIQRQFRLNSPYDPWTGQDVDPNNITCTGFQHVFGTSANGYRDGIYQDYTVLRTKITLTMLNEDIGQGAIVGQYINAVNGANLNFYSIANQPKWYKERIILGGNPTAVTTMVTKWDAAKFVGSDVRDMDEYRGTYNSNPANIIYLYVLARNMYNVTLENVIKCRLKLEYTLECTLPRDLQQGY